MGTTETSRQINYFGIGLFILAGIALIFITIVFLSTGSVFTKILYLETYFNESVQGLSVGSPVKYRGLDIGYVKKIAFVNEVYKSKMAHQAPYSRYIYVKMAITSSFLTDGFLPRNITFAQKEVTDGLRAQIAQQGLTGTAFVEFNYVSPKNNPPLPLDWNPNNYYIPSAISTLTSFADNAREILNNLKQVNFASTFNKLDTLAVSTNQVMTRTNVMLRDNGNKISTTLSNLNLMTHHLNSLIEQTKEYPAETFFGSPPPILDPNQL